jgi:hypothetical protein
MISADVPLTYKKSLNGGSRRFNYRWLFAHFYIIEFINTFKKIPVRGHDSNLNAACFDGLVQTGQPALI